MTKQLSLSVNDVPIEADYFVEGFIDHVMGGILEALESTGQIKSLDVSIEGDKVTINLNNALVVFSYLSPLLKLDHSSLLVLL